MRTSFDFLLQAPMTHENAHYVHWNGHAVAYARFGVPDAANVVFYLHGFPGSRLEAAVLDEDAKRLGVSIVAVDRPGFGRSTPQPGRTLEEFPPLLAHVADTLGIAQFALLGVSGGAPYAAVTAAQLGTRVRRVALVSGMGPVAGSIDGTQPPLQGMVNTNRMLLWLGMHLPALGSAVVRGIARAWAMYPRLMLAYFDFVMTERDVALLGEKPVRALLRHNLHEALRQGAAGVIDDFRLLTAPWRFSLRDVDAPVVVWHGDADNYVPPAFAHYYLTHLPRAELRLVPSEGHFLGVRVADDVLEDLMADAARQTPHAITPS